MPVIDFCFMYARTRAWVSVHHYVAPGDRLCNSKLCAALTPPPPTTEALARGAADSLLFLRFTARGRSETDDENKNICRFEAITSVHASRIPRLSVRLSRGRRMKHTGGGNFLSPAGGVGSRGILQHTIGELFSVVKRKNHAFLHNTLALHYFARPRRFLLQKKKNIFIHVPTNQPTNQPTYYTYSLGYVIRIACPIRRRA